MRFDSTLYYHVGDDYSWPKLFGEMRETVELLDQLAFDGVWLAEHHFAWDGWYRSGSNPMANDARSTQAPANSNTSALGLARFKPRAHRHGPWQSR